MSTWTFLEIEAKVILLKFKHFSYFDSFYQICANDDPSLTCIFIQEKQTFSGAFLQFIRSTL